MLSLPDYPNYRERPGLSERNDAQWGGYDVSE
jgi:hypothetical protein